MRPLASSRRVMMFAGLLTLVIVPPAATLIALGLQLLSQDRVLLLERERDRRLTVAQQAIRSLSQILADAEAGLARDDADGHVRLRWRDGRLDVTPRARVLWVPAMPAMAPAAFDRLAAVERLEYAGDIASARAGYIAATRASDPAVRAAAWLSRARVERRQERWDAAADAYRALAAVHDVAVEGMAADLVARRALCDVLAAAGREDDARAVAVELARDLLAGRWLLDRAAWEMVASDVSRWAAAALNDGGRRAMSEAADALWDVRPRGSSPRPGPWQVMETSGGVLTGRWLVQDGGFAAVLVSDVDLISGLERSRLEGTTEQVTLRTMSEAALLNGGAGIGEATTRLVPSETGLPWLLEVASVRPSALTEEFAQRRRLLGWGLVALLALLVGGSYLLWRVVQRELAVARGQSEFVAAVSHEFRTPLTAMKHATELLSEDCGELPAARRATFYDSLHRNIDRLSLLVESLLDVSRIESGQRSYARLPLDVPPLVERVVKEFQRTVAPAGTRIDCRVGGDGMTEVHGDADAIASALWNLLDNAVKYSPGAAIVQVHVERRPDHVVVSVVDRGIGIPSGERADIFRRFARGRDARVRGIKGTGLGLALVSHIMRVHGGRVEVESEVGAGSTFRLILPVTVSA